MSPFLTEPHKERFLEAMALMPRGMYAGRYDAEYASAAYLLTADPDIWEKAKGYITNVGISFKDLLKKVYLSTGERALVSLAANLFSAGRIQTYPIGLMDLDDKLFSAALEALKIRRNGLTVEEVQAA